MEVDRHFQNATFSIHLVFPETVMWNDLETLHTRLTYIILQIPTPSH